MKKTFKLNILVVCLATVAAALGSCEELTQPDLTGKQINIIAPVDNLVTTATTNTFARDPVDGAAKYQLQIVSPKFDSVARFVTDSAFTNSLLTYTLTPGVYQWRVRATNAGSQTIYFTRKITIQ
jgi:hypothetical protein